MKKSKSLKYLFFLVSLVVNTTYFFNQKKLKSKKLLIVRLDAIGDYILFRNFINVVKLSNRFKSYELYLLGNHKWSELSKEIDKKGIKCFLWIDPNQLWHNPIYTYNKIKAIRLNHFDLIISPVYSRNIHTDILIAALGGNLKIGSYGDLTNIKSWQKRLTNHFYHQLVQPSSKYLFEFDRNREFFSSIIKQEKIIADKPEISLKCSSKKNQLIQSPYAVIFIGASVKSRKWSIANYSEVAKKIFHEYGLRIVLCGGREEVSDSKDFKELAQIPFIDLVGITSLVEMLEILGNADILISNETSAPHMAMAIGTKRVFVISNGNHFSRFTPYPRNRFKAYHAIFPQKIMDRFSDEDYLNEKYFKGSTININEITPDQVIIELRKILNSKAEI